MKINCNLSYSHNIESQKIIWWTKYSFYFKDENWKLISYILFTIVENDYWNFVSKIWYINDLTTANWFEHFTSYMKEIYLKNWCEWKSWVKHFWELALNDVIKYIKKAYPDLELIVVNWLEKNTKHILDLVERLKSKFNDILHIYSWTDSSICSLKI